MGPPSSGRRWIKVPSLPGVVEASVAEKTWLVLDPILHEVSARTWWLDVTISAILPLLYELG